MRVRTIAAFSCCLLAAACAERPTQPVTSPDFQITASSCPSFAAMESLISSIFPSGGDRSAALSRYRQITREVGSTPPGPDTASARAHSFQLIQFLLDKYQAGRLIGGQSASTQATLIQVLNGILCTVGLPPAFGPGSLGPDGAVAFIFPTTPDTTVVTGTLLAGVHVPGASVTEPSILTIQRLPDSPGPLLTSLDQYPLFYQFNLSPAGPFTQNVVIGVCLASNVTPPDPSRLRVAHNVAPDTTNSIEILPLAPAPFIDCTNAPTAMAPSSRGLDLALRAGSLLGRGLASLLLPQRLEAKMFASGGVGGTTKEFSPFGTVDTLGSMNANSAIEFRGPVGSSLTTLPSVVLTTPTGQPMANIPVTFAFTQGTGTLTGATTITNSLGVATLGGWTLSTTAQCARLSATASMVAGSGLTANPMTFFGCGR